MLVVVAAVSPFSTQILPAWFYYKLHGAGLFQLFFHKPLHQLFFLLILLWLLDAGQVAKSFLYVAWTCIHRGERQGERKGRELFGLCWLAEKLSLLSITHAAVHSCAGGGGNSCVATTHHILNLVVLLLSLSLSPLWLHQLRLPL